MRVLLTGGSGFIAAHVLDLLLEHGHSVVTTVRSQEKAQKIKEAHPNVGKDRLDFAIVEDIAQEGAFEQAVISDPPFEAVLHTASPFHFNVTDVKKQLLDPAIVGTTTLLKSVKKSAPTVKRIVITSSFAAIVNPFKGTWPEKTYSEDDWNPITWEQGLEDPTNGYRASKTFAEKAAWKFVEEEKPNFTVATINPPVVFGPIVHYLNSLSALNTSNERIRNAIQGKWKEGIPENGFVYAWVDVRDVALAHVNAAENAESSRYFATEGLYTNQEIAEIIRKNFPEYQKHLPEGLEGGDFPDGDSSKVFKVNNKRTSTLLGQDWVTLEKSIVDTVKSLQAVGA